ncbi:MAG TPA: preprotein translocase subunit SecG [Candidatus Eremiobacteraceae bacterium]|jgi:preprotein translocase subunit SecG|nr:preprotein translocase subunit SecG [Candidatus Eremiobacteraceae bacterium]
MIFWIFAFLAGGNAATVPTPKPLSSLLPNFQFQQETFGSTHPVLVTIIEAIFIACAVALVGLMSVQTTKNEGLSGSIGGRAESAYRGRLGFEQQLSRLTSGIAITFVIASIAYFLVTR